jgi:FKBP-type peptidyl-prolyl cis-trans isomerase
MKFKCVMVLGILILAGFANAAEDIILKDYKERVSYSIGVKIGNELKNLPVGLNVDLLARGIRDVLSETKPLMTEQEILETMAVLQKEITAMQQERVKVLAEKNKKEGEAFLAKNKGVEGVITLPSGLQYKVLKAGTGKTPTDTDTVTVHYRGTLIDGTEFDSSYRLGQAATLVVNRVIPGWTEALKLMKEGAKWQLIIPPHLAFGDRGAGNQIGPNVALIFEVELISIQDKK